MKIQPKYPVPDALIANPVRHCAALVITQDLVNGRMAEPHRALRNGTLTFVKSDGETYAITCQHVVSHYREMVVAGGESSYSMRTMVNGFIPVLDRFIQPSSQLADPPPDIAIRQIKPEFIEQLGKSPIDLDNLHDVPSTMDRAYAVGFPEGLKYHKQDGRQFYRVSMPNVAVVAELSSRPTRRFTMFAESANPVADINYSGMSGGPIYWTTGDAYGPIGIIYEGGAGTEANTIFVYGELATPEVIRTWVSQCQRFR